MQWHHWEWRKGWTYYKRFACNGVGIQQESYQVMYNLPFAWSDEYTTNYNLIKIYTSHLNIHNDSDSDNVSACLNIKE